MKIALRYTDLRHLEEPQVIGTCFSFPSKPNLNKIAIARIPFGKRYFRSTPCINVCDPLFAEERKPTNILMRSNKEQCNCNKCQ